MDIGQLTRILRGQRGVALPMALIALMILTALVVAFSVLATSEPTIAANQLRVAQARALAESGVERAAWALSNSAVTGGLAEPLPSPLPAPYDGSQLVAVSVGGTQVGGFRVTVAAGGASNERSIVAVGWVPTDSTSDARIKAHQRITATLAKIRFIDPPCALCVRGDLQITGSSVVNSRQDTSCGNKAGTYTTGSVDIGSGAAHVYGANGTTSGGNAAGSDLSGAFDIVRPDVGDSAQVQAFKDNFDAFAYTQSELDILKSVAKANGTYYQGAVTFNSSNPMPDGIIFVDTTTGDNITPSTPSEQFADVRISGNAGTGPNNSFNGWIIANGALRIDGNVKINGMVYAVNDLSYQGTGTGQIEGLVVSQNIRDVIATQIYDTTTTGNSAITFNCNYAKTGNGKIPQNWFVKAGSYKEVADP